PARTTLTAGTGMTIASTETITKALAKSDNNIGAIVIAVGNPTSTTTVSTSSRAELGPNVDATVTLGDFTLKAITQDKGVKAEATAIGGALTKISVGKATTTLTDPASVVVGAGSTITAAQGTALVQAQTETDAQAVADADNGGFFVTSDTTATTVVDSKAN